MLKLNEAAHTGIKRLEVHSKLMPNIGESKNPGVTPRKNSLPVAVDTEALAEAVSVTVDMQFNDSKSEFKSAVDEDEDHKNEDKGDIMDEFQS